MHKSLSKRQSWIKTWDLGRFQAAGTLPELPYPCGVIAGVVKG